MMMKLKTRYLHGAKRTKGIAEHLKVLYFGDAITKRSSQVTSAAEWSLALVNMAARPAPASAATRSANASACPDLSYPRAAFPVSPIPPRVLRYTPLSALILPPFRLVVSLARLASLPRLAASLPTQGQCAEAGRSTTSRRQPVVSVALEPHSAGSPFRTSYNLQLWQLFRDVEAQVRFCPMVWRQITLCSGGARMGPDTARSCSLHFALSLEVTQVALACRLLSLPPEIERKHIWVQCKSERDSCKGRGHKHTNCRGSRIRHWEKPPNKYRERPPRFGPYKEDGWFTPITLYTGKGGRRY